MKIELLSKRNLESALSLCERVFQFEDFDEFPQAELEASLGLGKYKEYFLKTKIKDMLYWVAIDEVAENKIVKGIVGLYSVSEDYPFSLIISHPEAERYVWLGYFGVDNSLRNNGIGCKLLKHAAANARDMGRKSLLLWSDESYKKARVFYEKKGFKILQTREINEGEFPKLNGLVIYCLDLLNTQAIK